MYETYQEHNRANAKRLELEADVVMVHDPEPAALVDARAPEASWIWRCHVDLLRPQRSVWDFLRSHIVRYDAVIVSLPQFAQRLPVPQFLVYPSIDPLSDKNRDLSRIEVDRILESLGVPRDKPILFQVSRFDRSKGAVGMIETYRLIKKSHDCRLVLVGGVPEGPEENEVFSEIQNSAGGDRDIHILLRPPISDLEINALQRAATIVFQNSTREEFGLTLAEALWKGKPVIGGEIGGVTAQIVHGLTGYVVNSPEGAAFYAKRLMNEPESMTSMGLHGREYARHRFLITRELQEYLGLIIHLREARKKVRRADP
jgi:trehalose synthase